MAGHDAREEDGLLRMSRPPASRAYNSEDDRGSRATRTDEKPPEAFNRPNLWPYARHSSKPQEPSPPPPINRRRSTRVDEQRRNPPQIVGAPGMDLSTPSHNHDGGGRETLPVGWAAPNRVTPQPVKPQPAIAGPPTTSPATRVENGRPGAVEIKRSRLSTLVAGLRRSVSEQPFRRQSSSFGVLGDNVYRYTPLGAKHFRLVRVLAARSSQVKCEILHRPFGDPPSYIAISYAWGDPSDTTKIMIRDERSLAFVEVHISKSLYHALEALRRKSEDVLVWADALSIDQQNRDEKSEQLLLMTDIYKNAQYVAVWLGPDGDDCDIATALLKDVATAARTGAYPVQVKSMFSSIAQGQSLPALAALFEREYWNRLWIVQEIFNAASIYVYCGSTEPLPWDDYQTASRVFWRYKKDLEDLLPRNHNVVSHKQYSYSQILAYSGPGGLPELDSLTGLGDEALLEVLRMCRRKLSSDPKDKVFGVLGVLGKEVREEFTVDYGKSVKDVYTDVVDFLLTTTDRLDVICEAVHFPVHTSSANLPTWVPDWSHIPATSALALLPGSGFAASRDAKADYRFLGERRSQLVISAIPLGSISRHGIPVGTLCTLQDYLMAFLNWRALFLNDLGRTPTVQEKFCETICCRQIPPEWKDKGRRAWMEACLHVFASLLQERLPCLAIDSELASYANMDVGLKTEANRRFLQYHFGSRMMGRCFCLTNEGCMGLGTGFMAPNDEVVVPLGCSTPVLLRPEGNRGEYRFIGDVYIDGYMHGEAMDDLDSNKRRLKRYVIH